MLSISSFSIISVWNCIIQLNENGIPSDVFWLIPSNFEILKALASFPTIILSFDYLFNFFPIFKSLRKPTDSTMKLVSLYGQFGSLSLYILVGVSGYLAYG